MTQPLFCWFSSVDNLLNINLHVMNDLDGGILGFQTVLHQETWGKEDLKWTKGSLKVKPPELDIFQTNWSAALNLSREMSDRSIPIEVNLERRDSGIDQFPSYRKSSTAALRSLYNCAGVLKI